MSTLVLVRHGESVWNQAEVFAGWVDVGLTDVGREEATRAGELLAATGQLPDIVHTSVLRRSTDTAQLMLDACDRHRVPVRRSWRLNERHYGALQGRSKVEVRDRYGELRLARWRRGIEAPPPLPDDDRWSSASDDRYAASPGADLPRSESLVDVRRRLLPYWYCAIRPHLRAGRTVVVVSHGNTLRMLMQHLEGFPDTDLAAREVETGVPVSYRLDEAMRPVSPPARRSGRVAPGADRP